jgi:periplasmic protein TonB
MGACIVFSLSLHALGAVVITILPYASSQIAPPSTSVDAGTHSIRVSLEKQTPEFDITQQLTRHDISLLPVQQALIPNVNPQTNSIQIPPENNQQSPVPTRTLAAPQQSTPAQATTPAALSPAPLSLPEIVVVSVLPASVPVNLPNEQAQQNDVDNINRKSSDDDGALTNAQIQGTLAPRYPARSRVRGEEGVVVLHVRVLATGTVSEIRVVQQPGHRRLVNAALEAIRAAKFTPAQRDGQAVSSWLEIPVRFVLE